MEKTKRVKIVTGLKCNIQCIFCYYQDNLKAPNRSFEDVKNDLIYAKKHGVREVDFSGGEPTVHPDLSRMIHEAKSIGMERICIISNGIKLADRKYLKSLSEAGLGEILFSVHGSEEKIHDKITNKAGSFNKISRALSNAASEGIKVRINTVVNRLNYIDLPNLGNYILPFKPIQVNFITINDWCFAKHLVDKLMLSYSDMSPKLKEVCEFLEQYVQFVNTRYIPFCFMDGYERFVCNHKQIMFDPFEWVPRVRAKIEAQSNPLRYLAILGYGFFMGRVFKKTFRAPLADLLDESVIEAIRRWFYKKGKTCKQCKFDNICDGVEKTYAKIFGLNELTPDCGKKIEHPAFFKNH